ncbi:MAG: carboxypeptidase-like regulatory domain-containing protein [Acidobacteriota bacterium]
MATRSEKLNRLVIQSPCTKPWDEMTGGDAERHCAECDRQVFDFQRMTQRQIATRIQASGGKLCAQITRGKDGRLLTLEPAYEPMAASNWAAHRASPVAAAVVSALLGIGTAAAKPLAEKPASAAGASDGHRAPAPDAKAKGGGRTALLRGNVHDESGTPKKGFQVVAVNTFDGQQRSTLTSEDGDFVFDNLGAGVYALDLSSDSFSAPPVADVVIQPGEARTVGLTVSPTPDESHSLGGALVAIKEPLRKIYGGSELVAIATVGKTRALHDDSGEVVTDLSIDLAFKGRASKRSVRVYHAAPYEGEGLAEPPGAQVLVLLNPREGESGPAYEFADYYYGLMPLSAAELPVYRERLNALARLSDWGGASPAPSDIAEWLVATVEEPLARTLVTAEIMEDLEALDRFAQGKDLTADHAAADLRAVVDHFLAEGKSFENDPSSEMVAAFLDGGNRERLVEALDSTRTLTEGDLGLFSVVLSFDREAATAWAIRTIRELAPENAPTGALRGELIQSLQEAIETPR